MTSSDFTPTVLEVIPSSTAWALVALAFLLLVVAPAVWSKRANRAVAVLNLVAETVIAAINAWRSPRH